MVAVTAPGVRPGDTGVVRERPVIFTGESVRAILAGRKSQTRRVVKELGGNRGGPVGPHVKFWRPGEEDPTRWCGCDGLGSVGWIRCPYGVVGDRLWCREVWASAYSRGCWGTIFRADGSYVQGKRRHEKGPHFNADDRPALRWRTPLFMPRWASRLTLEVTEVRVQRLQETSLDDARAEGVPQMHAEAVAAGMCQETHSLVGRDGPTCRDRWDNSTSVENYSRLWDTLNAKRGYPWASNPWVWAVSFIPARQPAAGERER